MPEFPRAVLFDLDDTIIRAHGRPEIAWQTVIGEFTEALAPLAPGAVLAAIGASADAFWAEPERHRIWRQRLREARREIVAAGFAELEKTGLAVPPRAVQERLADRFSDYRNENLSLFPDAHATLDALRDRGVRLALITNGAALHQREKIARFDLAHRFDHIQIEGEHGFGKPEERAYLHAMEALGVTAPDTWMIGDNLEWEVEVPQRLGIYAIWMDVHGEGLPPGSVVRPDRIIRSLGELLPAAPPALRSA